MMAEVNELRNQTPIRFRRHPSRYGCGTVLQTAERKPDITGYESCLTSGYSASHNGIGIAWRNMVMEPPPPELKTSMKWASEGELAPHLDLDPVSGATAWPHYLLYVFLRRTAQNPKVLAEALSMLLESVWPEMIFGR